VLEHLRPGAAGRYHRSIVSTGSRPYQPLGADGPFAAFAGDLIGRELPDLDAARRDETVVFICRRVRSLPSPLLIGVTLLAIAVGIAHRLAGSGRVTTFLQATRLPFVGELARLVRSLGFAYIWETWPDTSPTGAPLYGAAA
jgi:hypothetical protein